MSSMVASVGEVIVGNGAHRAPLDERGEQHGADATASGPEPAGQGRRRPGHLVAAGGGIAPGALIGVGLIEGDLAAGRPS